jgi:uncharacterized protein YkwD
MLKLKSLKALSLIVVLFVLNSCTDENLPVTETAVAPVAPSASTPATPMTVIPVASFTVDPLTTTTVARIRPTTTPPLADATIYSYSTIEIEIMDLINAYRVSTGLKALSKVNYISYKAEEHNKYMIFNNIVTHYGFDARYLDIKKVLGATGMGENIAFGFTSAQAVVNAWLASPGHKANIVGNFTHFGISVRADSNGKKYYTNIFAKI